MIAVQGPQARSLAATLFDERLREAALALPAFYALESGELLVARTGYTGEDGWEIVMPAGEAAGPIRLRVRISASSYANPAPFGR